jgi:protein-L-isoaspartate(D-aspartate) O-methyltransferase
MVLDGTELVSPNSGKPIVKDANTPALMYKGRLYFFCCPVCMQKCAGDPSLLRTAKPPNGFRMGETGQGPSGYTVRSVLDPARPGDANAAIHRIATPYGRQEERDRMVSQVATNGVKDERILEAMRRVPRHLMIPAEYRGPAYENRCTPMGHGQNIDQPFMLAFKTQALELKRGSRVLEIGTGSGYHAAILAEMVDDVHTVEILPELATMAASNLVSLGYTNVHVGLGDGYYGWEAEGPWDAIIVNCVPDHIPPALFRQLKPGGRMCTPVGPPGQIQQLLLIERAADGPGRAQTLMRTICEPTLREKEEGAP